MPLDPFPPLELDDALPLDPFPPLELDDALPLDPFPPLELDDALPLDPFPPLELDEALPLEAPLLPLLLELPPPLADDALELDAPDEPELEDPLEPPAPVDQPPARIALELSRLWERATASAIAAIATPDPKIASNKAYSAALAPLRSCSNFLNAPGILRSSFPESLKRWRRIVQHSLWLPDVPYRHVVRKPSGTHRLQIDRAARLSCFYLILRDRRGAHDNVRDKAQR